MRIAIDASSIVRTRQNAPTVSPFGTSLPTAGDARAQKMFTLSAGWILLVAMDGQHRHAGHDDCAMVATQPTMSPHAPGGHSPGATPRSRAGIGLGLIAFALAGPVFAALPYFGVGPDTSPTARTYIERRYGNIGIGLTAIWLVAMAVVSLSASS